MDATPTPYNSLYGMMIPPMTKKGPCCLHGEGCLSKDEVDENGYVKLVPPTKKRSDTTEKNLRRAVKAMKTMELGEESSRHRKSRKKMKKKDETSRKEKPFDTLANLAAVVKEKLVKTCYLGVKTWKEAEEFVTNPTDFRLYHRMGQPSLNDLEPSLSMFVCYMNASRRFKHFRVKEQTTRGVITYSVEYGQMDSPTHPSLDHLVRYYHTQFFPHRKNGEQQFDAFPSWSDSSY